MLHWWRQRRRRVQWYGTLRRNASAHHQLITLQNNNARWLRHRREWKIMPRSRRRGTLSQLDDPMRTKWRGARRARRRRSLGDLSRIRRRRRALLLSRARIGRGGTCTAGWRREWIDLTFHGPLAHALPNSD